MNNKKNKKNKKRYSYSKPPRSEYIVYTDGGCRNNPGGPGGIGVVIIDSASGEKRECSEGYVSTTNNRMELRAILTALEKLPKVCSVKLCSDSEYALNCISGKWQKKKNIDLWEQIDRVLEGKTLDLMWIRGHKGNSFNERCDKLAAEAMDKEDKIIDEGYRDARFAETDTRSDNDIPDGKKETSISSGSRYPADGRDHPSMDIEISIPDKLGDKGPEMMSPKAYSEKYDVNLSCAKAVIEFYIKDDRAFSDYAALKTGGIDRHSARSKDKILIHYENSELIEKTVAAHVEKEKDQLSVLRWYERGLSLYDAIRKVLTDIEIRERTEKKKSS